MLKNQNTYIPNPSRLAAFVIVGITVFVYAPALQYGFLTSMDDEAYIFQNPYVKPLTLGNIFDIFTHFHVFYTYVPLTMVSYSLDFSLWEHNPFGYHLTSIILHAANAVLLFILLKSISIRIGTASIISLIYAIHPIHVESVVWISERKNLLSSFFIFLSLINYVRYANESGKSKNRLWASLGFFICALLSKSVAVMLPLALILYDLCLVKRGWRLYEKIPFFLGSLAISGIVLVWEGSKAGALVPYAGGSVVINMIYTLRVYVDYLGSILFPVNLSPIYHYIAADLESWKSLLSYVLIPFLLVVGFSSWKTKPVLTFGIGWFVIWLFPVSNLIPLNTLRQDRYLYLPCLSVLSLLIPIFERPKIVGNRLAFLSLSGLLIIGLGALTLKHLPHFGDNYSFRIRVAQICPQWAGAQYEAGVASWDAGKGLDSLYYTRRAIHYDPNHGGALNNMGAIWMDLGFYNRARPYFERSVSVGSKHAFAYRNLAILAEKTGRDMDKIEQWLKLYREKRGVSESEKDYNLSP